MMIWAMVSEVPLASIAVWIAVAVMAGYFETIRAGSMRQGLLVQIAIAAAGAFAAGSFFWRWGELVAADNPGSGITAPFVSGMIGATCIMATKDFAATVSRKLKIRSGS
jgi:uncharacterized membrane protein YeaQ/YmgE (transglycosylase-associated protein family)